MAVDYSAQRSRRTPPHVSLKTLRRATGLTQEQVCKAVTEVLGLETQMTRGALSAIESGTRGASKPMLDALAIAYGLDAGDIVTDFEPRQRDLDREPVPA